MKYVCWEHLELQFAIRKLLQDFHDYKDYHKPLAFANGNDFYWLWIGRNLRVSIYFT